MSAVGARGGILGGEVVCVEGAVPLEAPPESVDVVRVAEARHEVRLRALQEADLIWKCGGEDWRIHNIDCLCRMIAFSEKEYEERKMTKHVINLNSVKWNELIIQLSNKARPLKHFMYKIHREILSLWPAVPSCYGDGGNRKAKSSVLETNTRIPVSLK